MGWNFPRSWIFKELNFQGPGFLESGISGTGLPALVIERRSSSPVNDAYQKTAACNKFSTPHLALDLVRQNSHLLVMTTKPTDDASMPEVADAMADGSRRELSAAARRALAEAAARRAEIDRKSSDRPEEVNGRGGPDPARYGDWEVKGIASDF
jgi:hypothetical protein